MTIHYLRHSPTGFTVLGHWTIAAGGTDYGKMVPWNVRTDLDDVPTMLLTNHYGGMGCSSETDTIVALTPTGPEERLRFTVQSSYQRDFDIKHGPGDYNYTGKIVPMVRGRQFAVNFTGTRSQQVIYNKQPDGTYFNNDTNTSDFPPGC